MEFVRSHAVSPLSFLASLGADCTCAVRSTLDTFQSAAGAHHRKVYCITLINSSSALSSPPSSSNLPTSEFSKFTCYHHRQQYNHQRHLPPHSNYSFPPGCRQQKLFIVFPLASPSITPNYRVASKCCEKVFLVFIKSSRAFDTFANCKGEMDSRRRRRWG